MATTATPRPTASKKKNQPQKSTGTGLLIGITVAMVAVGILIVVLISGGDTPTTVTGANGQKVSEFQNVKVDGKIEPMPEGGANDTEIGKAAPTATGKDFAGNDVTLITRGTPTMIVFLAHWCPHCNAEAPLIVDWMKVNGNKGVDVVAVTTGSDSAKPNWPPSSWLANLGWGGRVLADSKDATLAQAYGLTGYPYIVFVDAQGNVTARMSGEKPIADIDAEIAKINPQT